MILFYKLENKIPDTDRLVRKTDYNSKISEKEKKIPSISDLATNVALTAVESKIPDVSSLIKKQIITRKSVKLKINLLIIIKINILVLQSLTF